MAKISESRGLKGQGRVEGATTPGEPEPQGGHRQEPSSQLDESHWGTGAEMLPHLSPPMSHPLLVLPLAGPARKPEDEGARGEIVTTCCRPPPGHTSEDEGGEQLQKGQ